MARPYLALAQHFSLWSRPLSCSASWHWDSRWLRAARRRCRCCAWLPSRWWCPRRWRPVPGWRPSRRRCEHCQDSACYATRRNGSRWRSPVTRLRVRPRSSHCGKTSDFRQRRPHSICCAALIATLPDLAWGVGGKVSAVKYPRGLGVGRGDHQRRPAPGRRPSRRQHAAFRVGRRCAGARPVTAMGAGRRAVDRRPVHRRSDGARRG